jgi:TRAP transporter TAXI family solute receptor
MQNSRSLLFALLGFVVLTVAGLPCFEHAQAQTPGRTTSRYEEKRRETNEINVAIMTSGMTCTCAHFAEDIRNVVNDLRPGGIRVLPILGVGGLQNLNDVLFMKNMDMAIVSEDNIAALKEVDPELYADVEKRVQYITKLYNGEFHILARKDITTLANLEGKKVNFTLKDSQNDVTANHLFNMLNLKVKRSYYDVETSISKLLKGEIDATIMLTGAPQSAVAKLKSSDGVHLLSVDEAGLPGYDLTRVFTQYLPGELKHETYPNLIPKGKTVQTIVIRSLLVTYAWPENSEQYRRMSRFVNDFFGKIDRFSEGGRHPKWREVNLWTDIPHWTRFKPAAEWLAVNKKNVARADDAEQALQKFLDSRQRDPNAATLSEDDREALLNRIKQYLEAQNARERGQLAR